MNISFQLSVWTGIEGDDHPEYHLSNIHDPLASVTRLCCDSFADWEFFLQIFGGVEDTHKTLVKKATHKTPERDKEKEEERGSSVYDSRSSLRRWLRENSLSIGNMETRYWLLLFLVIGQNSCHIDDQLWHYLPLMYLCNNCQLWDRLKTNFSARFFYNISNIRQYILYCIVNFAIFTMIKYAYVLSPHVERHGRLYYYDYIIFVLLYYD